MLRILISFLLSVSLSGPAFALCQGQDLRPGLSAAQRADLQARVAETPYSEGNYWIATRGSEVIHLVGTLHLHDARMAGPVARLTPIVQSAGALLLEATDLDEAEMQTMLAQDPSLLFLSQETLIDLMPAEDWDVLAQAAKARGIPPYMAAKFQPWYLSMTLSMPPCMISQVQTASDGLDGQLNAIANAAGVTTQSLESIETLFEIFAAEPIDEQIKLLFAGLMDDQTSADQMKTLFEAYFEEKVAQGWHLSRVLAPSLTGLSERELDDVFGKLEAKLLIKRNQSWIPVILRAAQTQDAHIVVAFGAAHLMGDLGILSLLAQQGFTLQRQSF